MIKKLFSPFFFTLFFLGSTAFAGFFDFPESGFEEKMLKEGVGGGEGVSLGTVAVDNGGNIYYLIDNMQAVSEGKESFTFEELQEIEYNVKIAKISSTGGESIFAEGGFPLATSIAGILFDNTTRRLFVFLKNLEINEVDCPFLSPNTLTVEVTGKSAGLSGDQGKKVWNWSGLENCFREKLSIIAISGFRKATPF